MTEQERTGSIIRIIGPVLDVRFKEGTEPPIKTLLVTKTDTPVHIEVVQHHSPGVDPNGHLHFIRHGKQHNCGYN